MATRIYEPTYTPPKTAATTTKTTAAKTVVMPKPVAVAPKPYVAPSSLTATKPIPTASTVAKPKPYVAPSSLTATKPIPTAQTVAQPKTVAAQPVTTTPRTTTPRTTTPRTGVSHADVDKAPVVISPPALPKAKGEVPGQPSTPAAPSGGGNAGNREGRGSDVSRERSNAGAKAQATGTTRKGAKDWKVNKRGIRAKASSGFGGVKGGRGVITGSAKVYRPRAPRD